VPISQWADWTVLFRYRRIEDPTLYWLDLSVGLLLVAASEELVCRRLAFGWLSSAGKNGFQIVAISAVLFAFAHWARGLGNIILALLVGLLYMALYLQLKRIWPLVVAHWLDDFIAFS